MNEEMDLTLSQADAMETAAEGTPEKKKNRRKKTVRNVAAKRGAPESVAQVENAGAREQAKDNPEIVLKMNDNEESEVSISEEKAKSEGNEKPSKIKEISAKVKEKWNNLVSKLDKDKRGNKE